MAKGKSADYGPLEFPNNVDVNDDVPSEEMMAKVANYPVLDADGNEVPFRTLYEGKNGANKNHKVLVIFIRHFFCGSCQDFVEHISKHLPPPAELQALATPASIVIVGHGGNSLISFYAEQTSCKFPIYTDPTKRLYSVLKMTRAYARGEQLPEWIKDATIPHAFFRSLGQFITRILHGDALSPGSGDQVGGEFLFEGGQVVWCHRMRNATDHSDLPKIRELLRLPAL